MNASAFPAPGQYRPGTSRLHGLDARLKVAAVPALVIATFAATTGAQLLLLTAVAAGGWLCAGLPWAFLRRGGRFLRWLFLFTLLVHTLFTPGRTLFGSTWLSADGLATGALVCWRLALALAFALLLSATTPPARLATGLAWFFAPLERLGVRVREGRDMVLLVLHFIPLFRSEAAALHRRLAAGEPAGPPVTPLARARFAGRLLRPLLLRLVDRADELAHQLAAGAPLPGTEGQEGRLPALSRAALAACAAAALLLLALYRGLG